MFDEYVRQCEAMRWEEESLSKGKYLKWYMIKYLIPHFEVDVFRDAFKIHSPSPDTLPGARHTGHSMVCHPRIFRVILDAMSPIYEYEQNFYNIFT